MSQSPFAQPMKQAASRFTCLAGGIADIACGLALRRELDLLVRLLQLSGFAPGAIRQFVRREFRRSAGLFDSARF
jgi:hypothetical protein